MKPRSSYSVTSILSLSLAVAVLTLALLVIDGFYFGLKEVLVRHHGDVTLLASSPRSSKDISTFMHAHKNQIARHVPFLSFKGLILSSDQFQGTWIEGLDFSKLDSRLLKTWFKNKLPSDTTSSVILGSALAEKLQVRQGSSVHILTIPQDSLQRNKSKFSVGAVIDFGKHDLNERYALVSLNQAQSLTNQENLLSGLRFWLKDSTNLDNFIETLSLKSDDYELASWTDLDRELFYAIESDKRVIFLVLFILIIVAGFQVSSSLFIQVFKKTRDISVLKAMGASHGFIFRMFLWKSLKEGIIGSFLGIAGGLLIFQALLWLQKKWNFIPSSIYQINNLVTPQASWDLLWIVLGTLLITLLAGVLPARRAYKMHVKEGLSYE